jgi:hypothetical protein
MLVSRSSLTHSTMVRYRIRCLVSRLNHSDPAALSHTRSSTPSCAGNPHPASRCSPPATILAPAHVQPAESSRTTPLLTRARSSGSITPARGLGLTLPAQPCRHAVHAPRVGEDTYPPLAGNSSSFCERAHACLCPGRVVYCQKDV